MAADLCVSAHLLYIYRIHNIHHLPKYYRINNNIMIDLYTYCISFLCVWSTADYTTKRQKDQRGPFRNCLCGPYSPHSAVSVLAGARDKRIVAAFSITAQLPIYIILSRGREIGIVMLYTTNYAPEEVLVASFCVV